MSHRLVVHDDAVHGTDYVIAHLSRVLGVSRAEAARLAQNVHAHGRYGVPAPDLETARRWREELLAVGPDGSLARSDGSLIVSIEEALPGGAVRVLECGRRVAGKDEALDAPAVRSLQKRLAVANAPAPPPAPLRPGRLALIGAAIGVAVAAVVRRRPSPPTPEARA